MDESEFSELPTGLEDFCNEIILIVSEPEIVSYQKSFGVPNQDRGTNMAAMTSSQIQKFTWTPAWNFKEYE